jgi:hypothetical protein
MPLTPDPSYNLRLPHTQAERGEKNRFLSKGMRKFSRILATKQEKVKRERSNERPYEKSV